LFKQYNRLVNDKKIRMAEKIGNRMGVAVRGPMPQMKFFDKSCLKTENLFKLSVEDMHRSVAKIHSDLLSSSYFRQLGFDTSNDIMLEESTTSSVMSTSSNVTVLTSMSNTSNYEFRKAAFQEERKYIKEPQPYGNPFRLIIRPKNQVIQMSEIEDEAFMTNVEKKKSNRLASYANLYKQQMTNQLKKYGEWFRANQDSNSLDLKIRDLIKKHEEDKNLLVKREEELKKMIEKDKKFLEKRDFSELDTMNEMNENTETLTMVKSEKAVFKNDIHKFKASSSLFDDLCDLASRVRNLPAASDDAKNILKSQLRVLSSKYEEIFEPQFLTQRFEEFALSNFGFSF
jgi:hypothetical protein